MTPSGVVFIHSMMKRPDPTASLAIVAAATVVSGALAALSTGSGATPTVHAVERLETASIGVDGVHVPVTEVLERAVAAPATLDELRAETAVTPRVRLLVLDSVTGLGVEKVTVTIGGRLESFEPASGQPISLDGGAPDRRLQVRAAGYRDRDITVDGVESDGIREVHLERSTSLRGVVRDAYGAQMPHTRVQLIARADEATVDLQGRPSLRRTDEAGAFTFAGLEPGVYQTSVEVAGIAHLSRPLELRDGEWAQADHRLVTSTALSVQVDLPGGLPADRARLLIQRDGAQDPMTRYTDDRGRASIRPLPAGSYQLTVQSAEGVSAPRTFTIEEAGQGLVDLHVRLQAEPLSTED